MPLSNSRQTSVRRSHSKILSSLPPSQGILAVVLIEDLSAVITTAKMGKMQRLGVVAVILAFYSVHAKVYFREEFLDGGKFSCKYSDITAITDITVISNSFCFVLMFFHYFTSFKNYVRFIISDGKCQSRDSLKKNASIFSFLFSVH